MPPIRPNVHRDGSTRQYLNALFAPALPFVVAPQSGNTQAHEVRTALLDAVGVPASRRSMMPASRRQRYQR